MLAGAGLTGEASAWCSRPSGPLDRVTGMLARSIASTIRATAGPVACLVARCAAVLEQHGEIDRLRHEQRQRDQQRHLPGKVARPEPDAVQPPIVATRDFGGERIAAAPDGLDQLGVLGIGLDLPAQPADLVVDRAVERGAPRGPGSGRAAGRGSAPGAGASTQREQQVIFAGRERHRRRLRDRPARARPI